MHWELRTVDDQGIDFHKGSFGDIKRLKVLNLQLASDRCPDKNHDIIIEREQPFAGRLMVFEKLYDILLAFLNMADANRRVILCAVKIQPQ